MSYVNLSKVNWSLKNITLAVIALAVTALVLMRLFLGEDEWQLNKRIENGIVLYEPHFQSHPGHLTFLQAFKMAAEIDIYNTVFGQMAKDAAPVMENYPKMSMIGKPAPDFQLYSTAGELTSLSQNLGKINVFMFAAMTCPPARIQLPLWTELAKKYNTDEVDFFVVYSRERHPGEPGYREFSHTTTNKQKLNNAMLMSNMTSLKIAVDDINEKVLSDYGSMMNPSFVVNRKGILVFRSSWADVNKIEQVVDDMLSKNI